MKILLPDFLAPAQPEALSPLEEGLRGPDAAQLCATTQEQLKGLEQRVRAGMAAGVLPDRYRELTVLLDACLAAQEVVDSCAAPGSLIRALRT